MHPVVIVVVEKATQGFLCLKIAFRFITLDDFSFLLDINCNTVADLRPIGKLTSLLCLHIGQNPVADISVLRHLSHLTFFSAWQQSFAGLSPFGELASLQTLELIDSRFENPELTPLLHLPALEEVQFNASSIGVSLAPLAGLPHLRTVSSWLRRLTQADEFVHFTRLKRLHIKDNPLLAGEMDQRRKALPGCTIE